MADYTIDTGINGAFIYGLTATRKDLQANVL